MLIPRFLVYPSRLSYQCAIKPAINWNGLNGRNGGIFLFIISASSVCSVAMTTDRYQSG